MILYHRTSPEAAAAILASGRLLSRECGYAFASDRPSGQGEGYGSAVVRLEVASPELDDEFPDGERHYRFLAASARVLPR